MPAAPSPSPHSPVIRNDRGIVVHFESEWLKAALHRAAHKAGHEEWVLLEEFSTAITQYLQALDGETDIVLDDLEKVVRATLRDMGFPEIAARFRTVNPYQSISLLELAGDVTSTPRRPGPFFKRLAARIEALHAAKVQLLDFHDLEKCALHFTAGADTAGWWDRPLMGAHLVEFIRDCIATLQWDGTVRCTIR